MRVDTQDGAPLEGRDLIQAAQTGKKTKNWETDRGDQLKDCGGDPGETWSSVQDSGGTPGKKSGFESYVGDRMNWIYLVVFRQHCGVDEASRMTPSFLAWAISQSP